MTGSRAGAEDQPQEAEAQARNLTQAARRALAEGARLDMVAEDLRQACRLLGEITGESVTADVLRRLFSAFCLGK